MAAVQSIRGMEKFWKKGIMGVDRMANIQGVELLVVAKKDPDEKGRSWKLRLVQWVVDGEAKSVKLERRNFFATEEGETRAGKADGFSLKDLEALKPFWKQIVETMQNPPKFAGTANEINPEEVPY